MPIDNTTDPENIRLASLLLIATGNTDAVIQGQERAGQQQLVHSDRLPTDYRGDRADWEALGFTFGDPDPADRMFMPATLPNGWTKQGSDHDMWSYVVDEHGRRRVGIFYKAAFYDRSAFMSLHDVYAYVSTCVYEGMPVVTDEMWATRETVLAVALEGLRKAEERLGLWTRLGNATHVEQYAALRDKYAAVAARFDTGPVS